MPLQWMLLLALATVLTAFGFSTSNELLELTCLADKECEQFAHASTNASCINDHCQCSANGEIIACEPQNLTMSNIIGGHCPCVMPNAQCNDTEQICYCAPEYTPSDNKRRCIPISLSLGKRCEFDWQCQGTDNFALCVNDVCSCQEGFIKRNNTCASLVGKNVTCPDNVTCGIYGSHATCDLDQHVCVCEGGSVHSTNNSACVTNADYKKKCNDKIQCIGELGPGGVCMENLCECDEHFMPAQIKLDNGHLKTVCANIVEIGQYCHHADECHQHQLPDDQQTMDCFFGECSCKYGYHAVDNLMCEKGSSGCDLQQGVPALLLLAAISVYFLI